MIPIPDEIRTRLECLVGSPESLDPAPARIWEPARISFLAELSNRLLADPIARAYPDIVAFAFWCRRAHLVQSAEPWQDGPLRIGLGLVFHVAPSNVPINFAYSLAFAFLAGNASAVRLSSRVGDQGDIVAAGIARLLAEPGFQDLARTILVMRYERSDDVTAFWLNNSLGRIVWGGDATVQAMRLLGAHPRSREIAFVDRYSLAAVQATAVLHADAALLDDLCQRLYRDIFIMDQMACSSPQLLVWVGSAEDIEAAKARLWARFMAVVDNRFDLPPIRAMDKYAALCGELIEFDNIRSVSRHGNRLYRLQLASLSERQQDQRGASGVIHELDVEELSAVQALIDSRVQTLAYFGFTRDELREFILVHRLAGIDRIVPIGAALDMGFVWDGFDIVASLSRIIDLQ